MNRLFYVGLKPELIDVIKTLAAEDLVRVTSRSGESYIGYLFYPHVSERNEFLPTFGILFNQSLDRSTQTYAIWYDQIESIEKLRIFNPEIL